MIEERVANSITSRPVEISYASAELCHSETGRQHCFGMEQYFGGIADPLNANRECRGLPSGGVSTISGAAHRRSSDWGGGSNRFPVVRQQFTEPGDGVRKGEMEPSERLNAAPFVGSDEAS